MKFLLDMNLPPRWVQFLSDHGFECVHWSNVGEYTAKDSVIMAYAREHGYTVFTHDLDFGALLAATRGTGPSVIQIRTQNVVPEAIGDLVLNAIARFNHCGSIIPTVELKNISPTIFCHWLDHYREKAAT